MSEDRVEADNLQKDFIFLLDNASHTQHLLQKAIPCQTSESYECYSIG